MREMRVPQGGIDDMEHAVAGLDAFHDERHQDVVDLVEAVLQEDHVTITKLLTGQMHATPRRAQGRPPLRAAAVRGRRCSGKGSAVDSSRLRRGSSGDRSFRYETDRYCLD